MRTALSLLLLCWSNAPCAVAQTAASFEWRTATPESQGMSSAKLDALRDAIAPTTQAFLVIRNDRIVYEWYPEGRSATDKHYTASMAKAIVGGLSLAVAMEDGRISLDDPAWKYVPAWKDDPLRSKITVRHLGSHTSGIDDSHNREEQARGIDQGSYTGWAGEFWRWRQGKQRPPHDAFTISRDVAPMLFEPGTDFQYSNPGLAMLTWCVTASLKGAEHNDVRTLLRERIMRPLGVPDEEWSCGYGLTEEVDGLPLVANWGGGSYTPRATARIGRLVLGRGQWDGQRLLSAQAVKAVTGDAGLPGHCGMGWWTNADGRYDGLPRDAVWGAGAGHQILLVVPSLNLLAVRNGSELPAAGEDLEQRRRAVYERLFKPLIDALTNTADSTSAAPYPTSPAIESVMFDFGTEQVFGRGSDQWPMTWAGDGHIYAAWGDGWGWKADRATPKRSIGVTRIHGTPPKLSGEDLWGDGPGSGFGKPEALIALDDTLYMFWTRGDSKSDDFEARQPVFHDSNGYVWHVGVCHNPGLNRFLLTKSHYGPENDRQLVKPSESGVAGFGLFDAPRPWGPWTTIAYLDHLQDKLVKFSYFIPTKFLSEDGKTFWLAWSGWPEYDSVSFVKGTLTLREGSGRQ